MAYLDYAQNCFTRDTQSKPDAQYKSTTQNKFPNLTFSYLLFLILHHLAVDATNTNA